MNYASALFSRSQCTEDTSDLDDTSSEYHDILNASTLKNKLRRATSSLILSYPGLKFSMTLSTSIVALTIRVLLWEQ